MPLQKQKLAVIRNSKDFQHQAKDQQKAYKILFRDF